MYTIRKRFGPICAAHHLPDMPEGHPCKRPHGHNYFVEIELKSDALDEYGMVLDYGDLSEFKKAVMEEMDHRDLNANLDIMKACDCQPTAERLAKFLFDLANHALVAAVSVSETPNTWAEYRP